MASFSAGNPLPRRQEGSETHFAKLCELAINVLVSLLSILLTFLPIHGDWAGFVYIAIGPLQFANGFWWGKRIQGSANKESPE